MLNDEGREAEKDGGRSCCVRSAHPTPTPTPTRPRSWRVDATQRTRRSKPFASQARMSGWSPNYFFAFRPLFRVFRRPIHWGRGRSNREPDPWHREEE